jgi:hypothetical protein
MRSCNHRPVLEELEPRLAPAAIDVLGYHYDNSNDGQYTVETTLTPSVVKPATFGKLHTVPLDGQVFAEPLYESGIRITAGAHPGIHNVVFLATEHDSVYAIDADNGQLLWKRSFINPAAGVTSVPDNDVNGALFPENGITGTPVIDLATNTLYFDATTKEIRSGVSHYVHRFWALQVADGSNQFGSPFVVADTVNQGGKFQYIIGPTVNGTGDGSVNGKVTFNSFRQMQRPGLTLLNGTVYVAYGSYNDNGLYHGWLLAFNHADSQNHLQLVAVFNTTPNASAGSIWQGGGRIAADASGNLYVETANGTFDTTLNANKFPLHGDYGDTFLKLAADPTTNPSHQNINGWGLKVVDYFTPFNQAILDSQDLDLGSSAPILLPASVGLPGHPLLFGGGKEGRIYLVDTSNMGKFDPNKDHVPKEELIPNFSTWGTPAYFQGHLYVVGSDFPAYAFAVGNGTFSSKPTSQSRDTFAYPGSTPYISSNGTANGIAWDLESSTGELRAYLASSYGTELYNSAQAANGRDRLGAVSNFSSPTVAHGKVYIGTLDGTLVIYGLLSAARPGEAASFGADVATAALGTALTGPSTATIHPSQAAITPALAVDGGIVSFTRTMTMPSGSVPLWLAEDNVDGFLSSWAARSQVRTLARTPARVHPPGDWLWEQ